MMSRQCASCDRPAASRAMRHSSNTAPRSFCRSLGAHLAARQVWNVGSRERVSISTATNRASVRDDHAYGVWWRQHGAVEKLSEDQIAPILSYWQPGTTRTPPQPTPKHLVKADMAPWLKTDT